jgi:ADP-heptose:LPS heptosyltransferase
MPELGERFLVVRLGSLGDIVHTFPAVAALRKTFPAANITWLTHPRWESLVAASGLATEIWATQTRSLGSLRSVIGRIHAARFSCAIDYQGLWKSAGLPFLAGVAKRVGFSAETIREWGVPVLYTERVRCERRHIAEQNGELSIRAGAKCCAADFALRVGDHDAAFVAAALRAGGVGDGGYVLLSPGGGWRSKCWPAERFGELAAEIYRGMGLRCVVNYGPGEEWLVEEVKRSAGDAGPVGFCGEMGKLMAVARGALCMVGGDTGPLHLAVALGTASVSVYGPTDPERNGPYPGFVLRDGVGGGGGVAVGAEGAAASRNVVFRAASAVRDHSRVDETDAAMLKISVGEVFGAVREMVAHVVGSRA